MSDTPYLDKLYQALHYSNEQFDKNVLFIASGALGISFAFVEKIVPNLKNACGKCLLISSWYFFAGVIFISLVAHFFSILALRWAIKNNENKSPEKSIIEDRWNLTVRIINGFMIAGLLAGMILLILFIHFNL